MIDLDSIGGKIRFIRLVNSLSQEKLANLCNIKFTVLNKIEQNKYKPNEETISNLCSVTGINPQWLLFNYSPIYIYKVIFLNLQVRPFLQKRFFSPFHEKMSLTIDNLIFYFKKHHTTLKCDMFQTDQELFLVVSCGDKYCIILKTEPVLLKYFKDALYKNSVPNFYYADEIEDMKRTDLPVNLITNTFGYFYRLMDDNFKVKELKESVDLYVKHLYSEDAKSNSALSDLNIILKDVKLNEIISPPVVMYVKDKVFKIIRYAKSLGATKEDITEVLKLMEE